MIDGIDLDIEGKLGEVQIRVALFYKSPGYTYQCSIIRRGWDVVMLELRELKKVQIVRTLEEA